MQITTEEFIARFQSLDGITIGERKKSLYQLLNEIGPNNGSELKLSQLKPNNLLDEKFKVECLVYFKKTNDLLEVLRSENPILIEIVLKSGCWFLEKALTRVTGEVLVNEIFSHLSFNTKQKVINKLALYLKDTQQSDDFFYAIDHKYGSFLSSKLLPCCSLNLILNYIGSPRVHLGSRSLLIIIKKYPDFTEKILDGYTKNHRISTDYDKVFIYIANRDINLFLKLLEKYYVNLKFGWRTTEKIVNSHKKDIIAKPNSYKFLKTKQVVKSLDVEFKYFYRNLFPATISEFLVSFRTLFQMIKFLKTDKKKIYILQSTFKDIYKTNLWDHPNCLQPEYLELLSPDERAVHVKPENKPSSMTEDEWMCYHVTEISIPYLKKKISLTSNMNKRTRLIELLVKTCKINKDKTALVDLCKFVAIKHRNDNFMIRQTFLHTLERSFDLKHLEKDHWKWINELFETIKLQKERNYYQSTYMEAEIYYRLENKLPVRELLINWILRKRATYNIHVKVPQYEKICLLTFVEIIPAVFTKELNSEHIRFLNAVINWNQRHPKDAISIFQFKDAIEAVKQRIINDDQVYTVHSIILYCLKLENSEEEKNVLLDLYFDLKQTSGNYKVMIWVLLNQPLRLIENIHLFVKSNYGSHYTSGKKYSWHICRLYAHLGIPTKIVEICLEHFNTKSHSLMELMPPLSYCMPHEDFLKFISTYCPTELRAKPKTPEEMDLYYTQDAIAKCLPNLLPQTLGFTTILQYCKGDYLKLVRKPLYFVSYNCNEEKLPEYLNQLIDRAVSVRKHVIHLTFKLLPKKQILNVLQHLMITEKNASVCKFIFSACFSYFCKNPSDDLWVLVMTSLNSVDNTDKEALAILNWNNNIPDEYFARYFVLKWDTLCKAEIPDDEVKSEKSSLLCSITKTYIQFIPKETSTKLIKDLLFTASDYSLQSAIQSYACKFILYCDSPIEQEERMKLQFVMLKNYINTTNKNKSSITHAVQYFREFTTEFHNEDLNKEILIKAAELWNGILKHYEAFDMLVYLHLTYILIEKLPLPEICDKVVKLYVSLTNEYGIMITNSFSDTLLEFAKWKFRNISQDSSLKLLNFIETLLEVDFNPKATLFLLALKLLKDLNRDIKHQGIVTYNKLINTFESNSDPLIQLHFYNYLSNFSLKDNNRDDDCFIVD